MSSALWDALGRLWIPMILGGTLFIKISCFVVGSVVPVSFVLERFVPRYLIFSSLSLQVGLPRPGGG